MVLLLASLVHCLNHYFLFSIPVSAYPSFHKHACVCVCVCVCVLIRLESYCTYSSLPWVVVVVVVGEKGAAPLKLWPNQLAPRAGPPDRQTDRQTDLQQPHLTLFLLLSQPHDAEHGLVPVKTSLPLSLSSH